MAPRSATPQALLGAAVRAERVRQKLSQEELAFRSELSTAFISHVERGTKTASVVTIKKLADGLSLTGSALLAKAGI